MQSSPKGFALIVNNICYPDQVSFRAGAAVDSKTLRSLLEQVNDCCKNDEFKLKYNYKSIIAPGSWVPCHVVS